MFDNLVFYNHFGAGDIFESREFVKEWIGTTKANNYFYAHGKHSKILRDIPELQYMQITDIMHPMKPYVIRGNDLYVNTWIGRNSKYVLPGIGCTVEKLYEMHNDILTSLGKEKLSRPLAMYIPKIRYEYYDIDNIFQFVKEHKERKILISNGPVQSNQASNFDMSESIVMLAHSFPNIAIIPSQRFETNYSNIYFTEDIIKSKEPFDLNEISYLSTFCDTIIGRSSGPHVFAQVRENWMDFDKVLVCFTYERTGACFLLADHFPMSKFWSPVVEAEEVFEIMRGAINR